MIRQLIFAAALAVPVVAMAQSATKYFGYFGGDYETDPVVTPSHPSLPEMQDHINLYSILFWSADTSPTGKAGSQQYVLDELARAKAAHIHAIVPAHPFVFQKGGDADNACWQMDSTAAASWASLSRAMVDKGYLIPGDPVRSTVVAVYIVDEPNGDACLSDVNGAPNPIFVNGVNAVRQDPNTAALPIASILTPDFNQFDKGMKLLDWVGYDHYGDSDSTWQKKMADLKSRTPGKKYIIVPGAMSGCSGVKVENTARYEQSITTDPDVVWLAPFAWFSGKGGTASCRGVRDIPDLRATYTRIGHAIKDQQCNASKGDKRYCGLTHSTSSAVNLLLEL